MEGFIAQRTELGEMDRRIQSMKNTAEELKQMAEGFPALYRNTLRILASLEIMRMNVSDILDI
jgi:hypothetical protein